MRIFTFRRLFGIAAIGAAYVHGKRGGNASWASINDTLRYIASTAADKLGVNRSERPAPPRHMPSRMGAANGLPNERPTRPQGG